METASGTRFDIRSRLGGHLHGDAPPAQDDCKAHGPWPVANTDTKLLIYGLFQKGRVLAQDGVRSSCHDKSRPKGKDFKKTMNLEADLNNFKHAEAVRQLVDEYARLPIGQGTCCEPGMLGIGQPDSA